MSVDRAMDFILEYAAGVTEETAFYLGDPLEANRLLWPLLALFQNPEGKLLSDDPYNSAGEVEVDRMLEDMATDPFCGTGDWTASKSRVLLERLRQTQVMLGAYSLAEEKVLLPCSSMPLAHRQVAAALQWLYQMELPFGPGFGPKKGQLLH